MVLASREEKLQRIQLRVTFDPFGENYSAYQNELWAGYEDNGLVAQAEGNWRNCWKKESMQGSYVWTVGCHESARREPVSQLVLCDLDMALVVSVGKLPVEAYGTVLFEIR